MKQVTLLNAIHMLNSAWKCVSSKTVENCFKHVGFCVVSLADDVVEEEFDPLGDIAFSEEITREDVEALMERDDAEGFVVY